MLWISYIYVVQEYFYITVFNRQYLIFVMRVAFEYNRRLVHDFPAIFIYFYCLPFFIREIIPKLVIAPRDTVMQLDYGTTERRSSFQCRENVSLCLRTQHSFLYAIDFA